MEKFDPLRFLARYWLLVLGIAAVVFAGSLYVYAKKPASAFGSMSVTVQVNKVYPETEQLILQTDNGTDAQVMVATTQAWLADPSYVTEILSHAGITPSDTSLKGLSKVFKVVVPVKDSTTYSVQFTGQNQDQVHKAFEQVQGLMTRVKDQYNLKQTGLKVDLFYSEPTITKQDSSLPLTPIAGLLAGLVFGIAVAALVERSKA